MKRITKYFIAVVRCISAYIPPVQAIIVPPQTGGVLQATSLTIPQKSEHVSHLGCSCSGVCNTKLFFIEIFSLYRPFCQCDISNVQEPYRITENNPNLNDTIRSIGIDAEKSPHEAGIFGKTYDTPFPLSENRDVSTHKVLGKARAPCRIGEKINDDETRRVFSQNVVASGKPFTF
ncbi:MAG TPA: hypothetical protein PKZ42_04030 [Syntrophales bacterium]|nr:hypothetical protein [Syntrophales bacterium]